MRRAKRLLLELGSLYESQQSEISSLRTVIEKLPSPVWIRDAAGRLTFVNAAYARAVEAPEPADAVRTESGTAGQRLADNIARERAVEGAFRPASRGWSQAPPSLDVLEFTPSRQRRPRHRRHRSGNPCAARSPAWSMPSPHARPAFNRRRHVRRRPQAHLLQRRYRAFWNLDAFYLDQPPTDSAVLDPCAPRGSSPRSRTPAVEGQLHTPTARSTDRARWHLPDGRTLRVVTTPNRTVAHLSVHRRTERLDLERAFRTDPRSGRDAGQSGGRRRGVRSDGGCVCPIRVRAMWQLPAQLLGGARTSRPSRWRAGRCTATTPPGSAASGHHRDRQPRGDFGRSNAATAPWSTARRCRCGRRDAGPFHDVTDSVNVERALLERKQRVEDATGSRSISVHHVSYELPRRSPTSSLRASCCDPPPHACDQQREYLDYITVSTNTRWR